MSNLQFSCFQLVNSKIVPHMDVFTTFSSGIWIVLLQEYCTLIVLQQNILLYVSTLSNSEVSEPSTLWQSLPSGYNLCLSGTGSIDSQLLRDIDHSTKSLRYK